MIFLGGDPFLLVDEAEVTVTDRGLLGGRCCSEGGAEKGPMIGDTADGLMGRSSDVAVLERVRRGDSL